MLCAKEVFLYTGCFIFFMILEDTDFFKSLKLWVAWIICSCLQQKVAGTLSCNLSLLSSLCFLLVFFLKETYLLTWRFFPLWMNSPSCFFHHCLGCAISLLWLFYAACRSVDSLAKP